MTRSIRLNYPNYLTPCPYSINSANGVKYPKTLERQYFQGLFVFVLGTRLELARLTTYAPQAYMSASFTTRAMRQS